MPLTVFGVRHDNQGVAAIKEGVSPHLPDGGKFDTVFAEYMDIPPLTSIGGLPEGPYDDYEKLVDNLGKKVLSIDGCMVIFDTITLMRETQATIRLDEAAERIKAGIRPEDRLYIDIGRLLGIQKEREEMMAGQLVRAHAGLNGEDAVFIGGQHKRVADHLIDAGVPATYVNAISPFEAQISQHFISFYDQDPFDINTDRFVTLWMINRMSEQFSPEQASRSLSLSEAKIDEVYEVAAAGFGFNQRTAPLEVDTVLDILS